jgi:signal transduction histidine kinase
LSPASLPSACDGLHDLDVTIGFLVPAGVSVLLASLLVVRAARSLPRVPLVELAIVGVMLTTLLTFGFAEGGVEAPPGLLAASTIAWLVLLFTYPDGRFVPAWSVLVLAAGAAGILVSQLLADAASVLLASFAIAFGIGVIGQVWRYRRRSSILERQATKWVLVGLIPATTVFLGIGLVASTTSLGPGAMEEGWYLVLSTAAIWLVPWCASIGILVPERGRADPIVHGLVVACGSILVLAWTYFIAEPVVGPRAAAAVTAALVVPVWLGLRHLATRLVYGRDPAMALEALGESLEQSPQPADVAAVVAQTVVDGLAVPYAAVTLASGIRHAVGEIGGADVEQFPVAYAGERTATIDVAPRRGDLGLAPRDRAMLRRLAASSGAALHAAVTLQRLQAARESLVLAREEERRRLRRDLHDDLAPALVALGFRAASASTLLERDARRAREVVDELQTGISASVERVREIAYDLRPPVLDDLGLMAAIRDRLDSDVPGHPRVELRGDLDEAHVPAAVQLAALRIVQEAVANVRRHAGASTCRVELAEEDGYLVVRVADDGSGVAAGARRGVGSRSIEERAAELGGRLSLATGPGGTTVEARLPLVGTVP